MSNTKINLIYPGSFDPFHAGHIDVIRRLYEDSDIDHLIVLLQPNRFKSSTMFDMNFKFNLIETAIKNKFPNSNIEVRRTDESSFSTYWHLTNLCSLEYKLVVGDDNLAGITKWTDFPLMIEHGLEIVVIQRELSYREVKEFKSILPITNVISHDKESVDATYRMSSTKIRNQIMDILNKNLTKE